MTTVTKRGTGKERFRMNAGKTSKRSILGLALLPLLAIAFLASSVNVAPRSQFALAKSPDSTVFVGTGLSENSSFLLWERDGLSEPARRLQKKC